MIFASYAGRDGINGTARVLFTTRLIFSRINGPIMMPDINIFLFEPRFHDKKVT